MSYRENCEASGPEEDNIVGNASINVVGNTKINAADDNVINVDSEIESGSRQSQQHGTQATFVGLSDLVSDLFGGSPHYGIQSEVGHRYDDSDFEYNVSNPRVVKEYEEMGFAGVGSDDGGDTDDLESLNGSETEEDEDYNPLPKKSSKGVNVKAWRRSVDLKNPIFAVGQAFLNAEVLKEAVRKFAIKNQLGL
ncbi:hypothetical protein M0R45_030938 [Rubus argutus]|uniref:Uncharacterized protein n=1 Tax=Rubus argutus TaxID=59490 RepID=A0AAW1WEZ5_RUBAR